MHNAAVNGISHSAFSVPHSAFRIQRSAFSVKNDSMKWVQLIILVLLIVAGLSATAQRRPGAGKVHERRLRLNELQLTEEQKRRIAAIIRRERMQNLMNQRELDEILTEKQKAMLTEWKKKRFGITSDSTANK
jgi:Spy/CpxP family protein refolding chaperone